MPKPMFRYTFRGKTECFERLVDNMTMENIDKYLKLNVAKIKESVQEVVELVE